MARARLKGSDRPNVTPETDAGGPWHHVHPSQSDTSIPAGLHSTDDTGRPARSATGFAIAKTGKKRPADKHFYQ